MKKRFTRRGGSFMIKTFGCKTNRADAEKISGLLHGAGWSPAGDKPSLCIVNSCCVTARSENKALKAALAFKKTYPSSEVVLSGCVADSLRESAVKSGIGVKNFEGDRQFFAGQKPACPRGKTQRYFLKVQNGCDNFCSYCVVPILRGAPVSYDQESVMRELGGLEGMGALPGEIVLTGTNINLYKNAGADIIDLIYAIREKYSCRIRLSSLEPPFEKDFVKRLSGAGNICPHFPVPLQSGSDRILKKMGRKYDTVVFEKMLGEIRKYFNDPAVTTDIIYGFPTETEKDFAETLDFMERAGFSKAHVFPFSSRGGTLASLYPGQPPDVMKERKKRILIKAEEGAERYRKKFVGKNLEVVAEMFHSPGRTRAGEWFCGTSGNYLKVKFFAENLNVMTGDIVKVAVEGSEEGIMKGIAMETLWTTKAKR